MSGMRPDPFGRSSMLAPNTALVQQFLTDTLHSWIVVTRASLAISHTSMDPPLKPPAWYPEARRTLDNLRTKSATWNQTESARVFNTLAQLLIDYGNLFVSAADEIAAGDQDQQLLVLGRLYDAARGNQTAADDLSASLGQYLTSLRAAQA